jgi:ribosomal protein S27E
MGTKGDESRLVRCKFCGFICDPDRDLQLKDGSFAGKGIDYGSQQSATITYRNGKTETIYYYEPTTNFGCPFCASGLYGGGK